jgi:hypothetical protein
MIVMRGANQGIFRVGSNTKLANEQGRGNPWRNNSQLMVRAFQLPKRER